MREPTIDTDVETRALSRNARFQALVAEARAGEAHGGASTEQVERELGTAQQDKVVARAYRQALARAVEEIPAFRDRAAYLKEQEAAGYPNAIREDEVDCFPAELRAKEGRPSRRRAKGDSGDVRVRMPRKLHRELAEQADRERVSLNTPIGTYLAREAGIRSVTAGEA